MDKHELFEIWAPPNGVWSAWAKPVLFAHLPRPLPIVEPTALPDLSWFPHDSEQRAVVVNLPGVEAVRLGVALAGRNYRPVPLFNACPPPMDSISSPPLSCAVIDVESTLAALVHYTEQLRERALSEHASPVFLVDANRQRPLQPIRPGLFDNRSVLFATDFPSASFLTSQRIERVLLICEQAGNIDRDLAYVLWTWQRAGISLTIKRGIDPGPIEPFSIGGWWYLFNFRHRISSAFRLWRNPQGGYGWFVPEASSG